MPQAERVRKCRVSFNERRDATKRTQETEKSNGGRGEEGEVAFSFNWKHDWEETKQVWNNKFNVSKWEFSFTRDKG